MPESSLSADESRRSQEPETVSTVRCTATIATDFSYPPLSCDLRQGKTARKARETELFSGSTAVAQRVVDLLGGQLAGVGFCAVASTAGAMWNRFHDSD